LKKKGRGAVKLANKKIKIQKKKNYKLGRPLAKKGKGPFKSHGRGYK